MTQFFLGENSLDFLAKFAGNLPFNTVKRKNIFLKLKFMKLRKKYRKFKFCFASKFF